MYNTSPSNRKLMDITAIERELIFDIDMSDYDKVRTCCVGSTCCNQCFSFMRLAVKLLDNILRSDFGFKFIIWVFSGRRGIHGWIFDKNAREATNELRSSITDYLSL